jgi:hypothetical protein
VQPVWCFRFCSFECLCEGAVAYFKFCPVRRISGPTKVVTRGWGWCRKSHNLYPAHD